MLFSLKAGTLTLTSAEEIIIDNGDGGDPSNDDLDVTLEGKFNPRCVFCS